MAGFGDIPIRQNGKGFLVTAEWFNTIRSKLIAAFGFGAYIAVQDLQVLADDNQIDLPVEAFKPFFPVVGDGAAVTLNSLPFTSLEAFQNGKEVVLMGTSDSNTVKLVSNDIANGLILNGTSVTLRNYHKITFMFYNNRFIEIDKNF